MLYPEATPATRSEREGARAAGRKLAEIWWAAKLRPSTPFSLQHRCTVKRYRDERFVLGITPSASCLRDGDGERQRRRPSPRATRTAQTATLAETKARLSGCCLRRSRLSATDCDRTATTPRHIFNPFGFRRKFARKCERKKDGEKTERDRPDFNLAPEAPVGGW